MFTSISSAPGWENPNLHREGSKSIKILATYLNHLVRTRRARDLESFDALMRGAGGEAREVLERFRENRAFDPEKILATELHIALDKDFLPTEASDGDARTPEYEGTLDLVMVHSLTEVEIDDWKSCYQIIDADTFQSKFYPLLLMCLNLSLVGALSRRNKIVIVVAMNSGKTRMKSE